MVDWELNLEDRETLRPKLVQRCVSASRKYLQYVQGGGGSPAQNQIDWCTQQLPYVASIGEQVSHYIMSETAFIAGGTSISDATLQTRVDYVLATYFVPDAV